MERPILFSTEMVQSILDGRKTQTRRIINHAPELIEESLRNISGNYQCYDALKCKFGIPSDILWVKETYYITLKNQIAYKANNPERFYCGWKPSLFMPKKYSRIRLEITDIKAEQLLQITEEDAIQEGVLYWNSFLFNEVRFKDYMNNSDDYRTATSSYFSLWDSINGKDSAKLNPWVWAITFKRIA